MPSYGMNDDLQKVSIMIIKAENICKSYGDLAVLKNVDFQVEKGEIVSIVGASGAGKTTFLQVIGTLLTPDSGTLEIAGLNALKGSERELAEFRNKHLGFVFQSHHLLPEFTALENVCLPALIAGEKEGQAKRHGVELLEKVGLSGRLDHKPSQLSGGEQQRVAIARSLINEPDVLLADEPTGNLDSNTKSEIHKLLFTLREELSQTIVIVTHDPLLASLCDRELDLSKYVGVSF